MRGAYEVIDSLTAVPSSDPPSADRSTEASELAVDAPGTEEIAVVAWPLLWRQRAAARASGSDRYPWVVLAASLFGLFAVGFTITVLSISLVDIASDLGSTSDVLTWVITGPILAYAVIGPVAGKLADLRGARRVYLVSLFAVTVFAAFTAIAWNAASLIGFRVRRRRGRRRDRPVLARDHQQAVPAASSAPRRWGTGRSSRPAVRSSVWWSAGPLVEVIGWRAIFAVQVPMTLLALVVGYLILPETDRRDDVKLDVIGSVLLGARCRQLARRAQPRPVDSAGRAPSSSSGSCCVRCCLWRSSWSSAGSAIR